MKKFFLILLASILLGAFVWDYQHEFVLQKDEVAGIEVVHHEDTSKRIFRLRWTLYKNERLVLLANYDGHPTQYILQKKYKRNSIKIALRDDYGIGAKRCFLVLTFSAFDTVNKSAHVKASVTDPMKRIEVKFVDPPKRKG